MKKTKIVCTIGPASNNYDTICKMAKEGMNVARLNLSHGSQESNQKIVDLIKKVRKDLNLPIAIMLDTRGPELRFGKFENDKITLKKGDIFTLVAENILGTCEFASINHPETLSLLNEGDKVLACNALVVMQVVGKKKGKVELKVLEGGDISNHKSLAFPGKKFNFEYLNDADKSDILFGIKNKIDYLALSFVNGKEDILSVKDFIKKNGGSIALISKIESSLGVDNLEEIIECSDGIMVARGDLGVEMPFEQIPHLQKMMIRKCLMQNKFVITATEMLESMITSSRPTRAEASDVANAVFDGSSAVMLSGESAAGKYPVRAVATMSKIVEETEKYVDHEDLHEDYLITSSDLPYVMAKTVANLAFELQDIKAVAVYTDSGHTAMMISKHFPPCPIIALTPNVETYYRLAAIRGVEPYLVKSIKTADKLISTIDKIVKTSGIVKSKEMVLIGTGTRKPTNTDMIKIHIVE